GAGRNIGEGDKPAVAGDALGKRGHAQGAAGRGAHLRAERRKAYVAHGNPAVLDQAHAVAVQAVTRGPATGRDRRGGGAGGGRKDRPMVGAPEASARHLVQEGSALACDPVPPQSIAANKYSSPGLGHTNLCRRVGVGWAKRRAFASRAHHWWARRRFAPA